MLHKAPVPDFAQLVKENCMSERVAGFALVEPDPHAAEQLDALPPVRIKRLRLMRPNSRRAKTRLFWCG